ncbi:MAG: hypothetical protein KGM49_00175 [Sphingomonadales bacterium]|nr:hypothetical protein [Sphingomonadales bacterium]
MLHELPAGQVCPPENYFISIGYAEKGDTFAFSRRFDPDGKQPGPKDDTDSTRSGRPDSFLKGRKTIRPLGTIPDSDPVAPASEPGVRLDQIEASKPFPAGEGAIQPNQDRT